MGKHTFVKWNNGEDVSGAAVVGEHPSGNLDLLGKEPGGQIRLHENKAEGTGGDTWAAPDGD